MTGALRLVDVVLPEPCAAATRGDGSVEPIEQRLEASHDLQVSRRLPDGRLGARVQWDLPRYGPGDRINLVLGPDPDCDACGGDRDRCPIPPSRSGVGGDNWRLCPNAM